MDDERKPVNRALVIGLVAGGLLLAGILGLVVVLFLGAAFLTVSAPKVVAVTRVNVKGTISIVKAEDGRVVVTLKSGDVVYTLAGDQTKALEDMDQKEVEAIGRVTEDGGKKTIAVDGFISTDIPKRTGTQIGGTPSKPKEKFP